MLKLIILFGFITATLAGYDNGFSEQFAWWDTVRLNNKIKTDRFFFTI